jgi:hypothetical protein
MLVELRRLPIGRQGLGKGTGDPLLFSPGKEDLRLFGSHAPSFSHVYHGKKSLDKKRGER